MPILVLLTLAAQVLCAIHVVRTGRQLYWLMIIAMLPGLGCGVYFITNILPDLRNDPRSRQVARKVLHTIDPERRRREIKHRLDVSDTIDNRRALAGESLRMGDYANAAELYRSCLKGLYATDPEFLLGLAHAQAGAGDFAAVRQTLETLIQANPNFQSSDGHLLYARSLEEIGEHEAALKEYEALATSFPGEEGRYRYAALLRKRERYADARNIYSEMLKREKAAPRYYKRKEKAWLDAARRELAAMGPG
jgi:hypothetical protein